MSDEARTKCEWGPCNETFPAGSRTGTGNDLKRFHSKSCAAKFNAAARVGMKLPKKMPCTSGKGRGLPKGWAP